MALDTIYSFAPGVEIIRKGSEILLLKSRHASVELKGPSADLFESKIASKLTGTCSVTEIAEQINLTDPEVLNSLLAELNRAGLLLTSNPDNREESLFSYFEMLGLDVRGIRSQFETLKILIFGQNPLGEAVAELLAELKPLHLMVCDPYPGLGYDEVNELRVARRLQSNHPNTSVSPSGVAELNERSTFDLCSDSNLVISTYGDRYSAVEHWINRAIHELRIPALYCGISSSKCHVGPLVFPGETACYTCWKMRSVACENDFAESMAYEEKLAKHQEPSTLAACEPSHLVSVTAGTLFNELFKCLVAAGRPRLTDSILVYEPFQTGWTDNPLLRRPDCPVCGKKKDRLPSCPIFEVIDKNVKSDILDFYDQLVGTENGLIRKIERIHKDVSEPKLPLIYRAEIANHRFLNKDEHSFITASGKGFTHQKALRSALGEAIERYSASAWGESAVRRCTARQLQCNYLNPERLVLFADEQYKELKYDPFDPSKELGWVSARSLATGEALALPALAVLMAYETVGQEPFLFPITSNGLAAGPSLYQAILSAAYEVIERDAFLYTWLNKIPCTKIDPLTHPDADIRAMVKSHARRRVDLELYAIPVDHGVPVFIGIAISQLEDPNEPAAVVGLGANYNTSDAAASALIEACQVRPALRVRIRQPETRDRIRELVESPQDVQTLEDHDLLYSHPAMLESFDFLRQVPITTHDWDGGTAPDDPLAALTHTLNNLGTDILYADLTTADVQPTGVRVVRVVIPDFQPMHFGFKERRLAAQRLYQMPVKLGITTSNSQKELNPLPHPLA